MPVLIKKILPYFYLLLLPILAWFYVRPYLSALNAPSSPTPTAQQSPSVLTNEQPRTYQFFHNQDSLQAARAEEFFSFQNNQAFFAETVPVAGQIAGTAAELSALVASAATGTTIRLAEGEYAVNLAIARDLKIIGSGSSTVLTAVLDSGEPVVKVISGRVEISNMTIKSGRTGIWAEQADLTVKHAVLYNISATAVFSQAGNLILNKSRIYQSGAAIKMINSKADISESSLTNNQLSGVEAMNSQVVLNNNYIADNGSYGVFADLTSQAVLTGNYIENNFGYNVRLENKAAIFD